MIKKRSKILLAMSILVITIFLIIQFLFQQTDLIPRLSKTLISMPMVLKESDKFHLIKDDVLINNNENVKELSDQQSITNSIQNQFNQETIIEDEDKSIVHHSNQSSDSLINEQQQFIKPEELVKLTIESKFTKKMKQLKIILWTNFFRTKNYIDESWKSNCDQTNCLFTSDRNLYHQSDALIFHSADINLTDLPVPPRNPEQRWIYLNHESPPHTLFIPVAVLNGQINWTVTYRSDSDILLSPHFIPTSSIADEIPINHFRPGMVAWLVSNCVTSSNREGYIEELKKHIPIDIYGTCGNLTCLPKMSAQCYDKLAEKYFFYLSFENSLCPDYVTEKFFSIMNHPIVPVVFGGADYSKVAPPNSYIDALSFESPAKLAQYLRHLTRNPEEYDVYFNWRRYFHQTYSHYACSICSALNKPEQSTKIWDNLSQWWFEEATCKRWLNGKLIPWK